MPKRVHGKVRGDDFGCFKDPVLTPRNSDGTCDCDGHKSRTSVVDTTLGLSRLLSNREDPTQYSGSLDAALAHLEHVDLEILCRCALIDAARDPADIISDREIAAALEYKELEATLTERLSPKTERLFAKVFGHR